MPSRDQLSDVLSEFARTLLTDFPIEGILEHLVRRIVDIMPIDAAGVSLISPTTHPRQIAGSDDDAIRYEHLQTELDEGPCLAAYATDQAISIADLSSDDRFPRFAERARAEGLAAVFTFPLRNGDRRLGALDLYRRQVGSLDEDDMTAAQTLADVATAYLLNAEARRSKSDFVAKVSHELRTPMTSITGLVELLQEGAAGELTPDQTSFVAAIARNGERLMTLANDLLTVTRLESETPGRRHLDVNLGTVVLAAQYHLEQVIADRSLNVVFAVSSSPVVVHGDAPDLETLVTNLVGNAVKFTKDGGSVRCELREVGGTARLTVTDNGLGIPDEEQRDLFTKFFRSTTARELAIQGSGLGLTIVKAIVQDHSGTISVVSKHLDGSTFTVTLPLAEPAHPRA